MAEYIDRDQLLELINEDCKYQNPTNEYTRGCNEVCDWAIKTIKNIPTADVVPKSEVERLKAELVRVQARHPFAMTLFELEACEKHAAIEAVKEVWRELRSMCDAPHWCVWLSEIDDYFEEKTGVKTEDISELKKKYTEN